MFFQLTSFNEFVLPHNEYAVVSIGRFFKNLCEQRNRNPYHSTPLEYAWSRHGFVLKGSSVMCGEISTWPRAVYRVKDLTHTLWCSLSVSDTVLLNEGNSWSCITFSLYFIEGEKAQGKTKMNEEVLFVCSYVCVSVQVCVCVCVQGPS